jgi:hypothetical protein
VTNVAAATTNRRRHLLGSSTMVSFVFTVRSNGLNSFLASLFVPEKTAPPFSRLARVHVPRPRRRKRLPHGGYYCTHRGCCRRYIGGGCRG